MTKEYQEEERLQQEDAIAGSTGKLIEYIVALYVEVAHQINVFKDTIYIHRVYDPLVVEKTVNDLNHLITVLYPYLPEDMRDVILTTSKSDLAKVIPTFKRLSEILYNKGFIKLDHYIKHKTYNLEELVNSALSDDMKQLRKEYKRLQKEYAKLQKENAELRKKLNELLPSSSEGGEG